MEAPNDFERIECEDDMAHLDHEPPDIKHALGAMLVPDEVELAEHPAYLRQLSKFPLLSREEEVELAKKIQEGDEKAYDTFFHSNLRLVLSIAFKVKLSARPTHLEVDDLFMEGNFGLTDAIRGFDPDLGFKFSAYAHPHIRGKMIRAISDKDRAIRISFNRVEKLASLNRRERKLQRKLGQQPTHDEIAADMGMTTEKLTELQAIARRPVSLDAPIDRNGESQAVLADRIVDDQAINPETEVIFPEGLDDTGIVRHAMLEVLEGYSDEQQFVMKQYYGWGGELPKTFKQIGEIVGYSRVRVSQIHHEMIDQFILNVKIHLMEQDFLHEPEAPAEQEVSVLI